MAFKIRAVQVACAACGRSIKEAFVDPDSEVLCGDCAWQGKIWAAKQAYRERTQRGKDCGDSKKSGRTD